jgi:hypothetical protein
MPNSGEIQRNLRAGRFFDGCKNSEDLASITTSGFRGEFYDDEGRWLRDGNLGKGVYLLIIFAPDRIQLSKVVRALDWPDYHRLGDLELLKGLSLEAFLQSTRESRDAPSRSASETPQKRR